MRTLNLSTSSAWDIGIALESERLRTFLTWILIHILPE